VSAQATPTHRRRSAEYRTFDWFAPEKRRASLYEDVTLDTQPSTERHWTGPYPAHHPDGRGIWYAESTAMRSTDWFGFRDPEQIWERTYYQAGAAAEKAIEAVMANARENALFAHFPEDWVQVLRDDLQVVSFMDYGEWLPLAGAQRDCLSDTLAHAVGIDAGYKQRQYQALVLYGMDLESEFGDFAVAHCKDRWLTHEPYQPLRWVIERLQAITDWLEQAVAINLCLEPIVGVALRRELFMRGGAANGDLVTPQVVRPAQNEHAASRAWTMELVRHVLADAEHGAANAAVLDGWVADWSGQALQALTALERVFAAVPNGLRFAGIVERVRTEQATLIAGAGAAPREGARP
jgi:propane monooxygenase small subunit